MLVKIRAQQSDLERHSDRSVLQQLRQEYELLWPAIPENIAAIEHWVEREARPLGRRLTRHRDDLERLQSLDAAMFQDDPSLRGDLELLVDLVESMEMFFDPEAGEFAIARERLDFARSVHALTIEAPRESWVEAAANVARDPRFAGLVLVPQTGLVPLGPDPETGLEEFAHVQSGVPPRRDSDGRLSIDAASSLVLVLIPPGEFMMGSRRLRAGESLETPNASLRARGRTPVHRVTIGAPFFLSKYEMTQGQWQRLYRDNPSEASVGIYSGETITPRHPVEKVTWNRANQAMQEVGLVLPTEAQWEYAARAGTTTPWWTGTSPQSLRGAENVADLTFSRWPQATPQFSPELEDGFIFHAPVGSFRANPFGLHDVSGNVAEWTRDQGADYDAPTELRDGFRSGGRRDHHVFRGGFWRSIVEVSERFPMNEGTMFDIGVRPARTVDGS